MDPFNPHMGYLLAAYTLQVFGMGALYWCWYLLTGAARTSNMLMDLDINSFLNTFGVFFQHIIHHYRNP